MINQCKQAHLCARLSQTMVQWASSGDMYVLWLPHFSGKEQFTPVLRIHRFKRKKMVLVDIYSVLG